MELAKLPHYYPYFALANGIPVLPGEGTAAGADSALPLEPATGSHRMLDRVNAANWLFTLRPQKSSPKLKETDS